MPSVLLASSVFSRVISSASMLTVNTSIAIGIPRTKAECRRGVHLDHLSKSSLGNTIPQGVSPAVTKTVPELEIVPRYNRFLQLLEDVIVAATFEAFAVVGVDVDRAIVVDVDLCVGFSHDAR
jgi:hypothetical protein